MKNVPNRRAINTLRLIGLATLNVETFARRQNSEILGIILGIRRNIGTYDTSQRFFNGFLQTFFK